jgi:hypothetical protein
LACQRQTVASGAFILPSRPGNGRGARPVLNRPYIQALPKRLPFSLKGGFNFLKKIRPEKNREIFRFFSI